MEWVEALASDVMREAGASKPLMLRLGSARRSVLVTYYIYGCCVRGCETLEEMERRGGVYIIHQLLHSRPVRVFLPLRRGGCRNREVDLLPGGVLDVLEEIGEVGWGLEVDLAMVGVHLGVVEWGLR